MDYNRAALKNEVKRDIRQTCPKAVWVTLVFLVVSYVITAVVALVQGSFTAGTGDLVNGLQGLMLQLEMGLIDERMFLTELMGMTGSLGQIVTVGVAAGLVNAVINWTLSFGYQGYCLNMVRGKNPGYSRLLCAFPQWGWVLLTGLLVALFTILWTILFCILGVVATVVLALLLPNSMGVTLTIVAWLAVAAGIISISLRYSMANYILLDERVDSLEAISRSTAMMRGRKWHLFVLQLSFIGWYLLTGLISGIVSSIGSIVSMSAGFSAADPVVSFLNLTGGLRLTTVLIWVLTLPLLMWLRPYVTGAEARFYDQMKRLDQEHGVWEGRGNHRAPDVSRYEPPVPPRNPEPIAPPKAPERPDPSENAPDQPDPSKNAPDRPNYE